MNIKNLLIILLIYTNSNIIIAQNKRQDMQYRIDSLNDVIKSSKHDTCIAMSYIALAEILYISNFDTILPLCKQAKEISEQNLKKQSLKKEERLAFNKILAASLNNIGFVLKNKGEVKKALDYYYRSLEIQKIIGEKEGIGYSYNNIASIYMNHGEIKKALEFFERSLKIREEINDKQGIASSFINIGSIHEHQSDLELALEYYKKSFDIYKELNDKRGMALSYNNLGLVYNKQGNTNKALEYLMLGLKLKEEINDIYGMANSVSNIGKIYMSQGKTDKALLNLNKSLELRKEIGDKDGMCYSYLNLGSVYWEKGDLSTAKQYFIKSLSIAKELGYPKNIKNSAFELSKLYKKEKNYKKGWEMYELFVHMRDSIYNEETQKAAIKQNIKYEYEKEALADSLAFEEQKRLEAIRHQQDIEKQQTYTYVGLGGFVLMSLLAFTIFRGYNQKKKNNIILREKNAIISQQKANVESQKKQIETQHNILTEQHKEITDSINYAKRIQTALLTEDSEWEKISKEYMVILKPKNVVSGDFFWAFHNQEKNLSVWVAADCTGHGVPGAFMSMLGIGFLNEIIVESKITKANEILEKLRNKIIYVLEQKNIDTQQYDGIDMALCVWDKNTNTLEYCGAYNPLWIARNIENITPLQKTAPRTLIDEKQNRALIEFTANKQPVGSHKIGIKPFSSIKIQLFANDILYTFSDGFPDQFGGPNVKKFKYKPFKQLLLKNSNKPMNEQKEILNTVFEEWKGNLSQIDDVCVVGIKVTTEDN